jgi:hypothetical protein
MAAATRRDLAMNLPKIDISSLPELDVLTGIFGSIKHLDLGLAASNDLIIVLMVYIWELNPTG